MCEHTLILDNYIRTSCHIQFNRSSAILRPKGNREILECERKEKDFQLEESSNYTVNNLHINVQYTKYDVIAIVIVIKFTKSQAL